MDKQERMDDEDRISNLPDDILSHILSFLSTKEAVGTSILSTRWRYLFALVTNLHFEFDSHELTQGWLRYKSLSRPIESFMSFVDRVLYFHNTTCIEKLCMKLNNAADSSRVYEWLSLAFRHKVRHLELYILNGKLALPAVLFTCRTLVTLKLNFRFYYVLNVPNEVCLPNLKTLHLRFTKFLNDDSVKRLFSSCIILEDMVMKDCDLRNVSQVNVSHHLLKRLTIVYCGNYACNYWIVIDAPMLVHFKYMDDVPAGFALKNFQSLISAEIDVDERNNLQADVRLLFRGIRDVQSLKIALASLKLLLSCEPVPSFPNMERLEICRPLYRKKDYVFPKTGLGTLLRGSSELKELALYQEVVSFHDVCNYPPEELPYCLSFKLKAIEISEFVAEKHCIESAKYYLKNAGVLEKLIIRTMSYVDEKEKLNIKQEFLASPRKSKQCCILII